MPNHSLVVTDQPHTHPGLYLHYKGVVYVVTGAGRGSTDGVDDGETIVRYYSLDHGPAHECYRQAKQFAEVIEWPDGVKRPRFARVASMEIAPAPVVKRTATAKVRFDALTVHVVAEDPQARASIVTKLCGVDGVEIELEIDADFNVVSGRLLGM